MKTFKITFYTILVIYTFVHLLVQIKKKDPPEIYPLNILKLNVAHKLLMPNFVENHYAIFEFQVSALNLYPLNISVIFDFT